MSIISTKFMPGGDSTRVGGDQLSTSTAIWQVLCDSERDTSRTVARESKQHKLPQPGEFYQIEDESDQFCFASSIDITAVDRVRGETAPGKLFDYKVSYSNQALDLSGVEEQNNPNPLARPPRMRMDFQRLTEEYSKDINDDAIVNSAGDSYDPLPTRNRSLPVLVITRNEYPFSPSFAVKYADRINTDAFFGAGPRQVYCDSITPSERQTLNDIDYYEVEYRFIFNHLGWDHDLLDIGFRSRQLINGEFKVSIIKDDAGVPGFRGWLLDGTGFRSASGKATYASKWRAGGAYKPYIAVPFAGMSLPNNYY